MGRLSAFGTTVDLGAGWEGEIYRRSDQWSAPSPGSYAGLEPDGSRMPTVVHLATFPLAASRGDFGGGALGAMSSRDVFITIFEYGPEDAASALFAHDGPPWPFRGDDFRPEAVRVATANQTGLQRFFHIGVRAFCVYVVLGSHTLRYLLVGAANDALAAIRFD